MPRRHDRPDTMRQSLVIDHSGKFVSTDATIRIDRGTIVNDRKIHVDANALTRAVLAWVDAHAGRQQQVPQEYVSQSTRRTGYALSFHKDSP